MSKKAMSTKMKAMMKKKKVSKAANVFMGGAQMSG